MKDGSDRADLEARMQDPEQTSDALFELQERLRSHRTLSEFLFAHRLLSGVAPSVLGEGRQSIRVALLGSFTADFLVPLLRTDLFIEDLACDLYVSGFDQFRQELLNPVSGLHSFGPEVTFAFFRLEDVFRAQVAEFYTLDQAGRDSFVRDVLTLYENLALAWRERGRGVLLLADQSIPDSAWLPLSPGSSGWPELVTEINRRLGRLCSAHPGVYRFGWGELRSRCGAEAFSDPRLLYTASIPVAREHWLCLADACVRHIKAALGLQVKCVVLDLDNTLWGGVLGEDGTAGLQLGPTWPGSAYRDFQAYLAGLHAAGFVLALASKNNLDDVGAVLRDHPQMLLRERHFAAIRANWNEKAENIREISEEIGLSLDQMLFIDDNPLEIAKIRAALPQVACHQVSVPPLDFRRRLAALRCFDRLEVTTEDRERGDYYVRERERRELRRRAPSLEEFYASLEQRLTIRENHTPHVARMAQLSRRTNQFNMTTLRLSEDDVARLITDSHHLLVTGELSDRLGDSGVVAMVQVLCGTETWHIENFLMSCRVLGRGAEEALVDHVAGRAAAAGAQLLTAAYEPTAKNEPFSDFYARTGFEAADDSVPPRRYRCDPLRRERRANHMEIFLG